MLQKAPLLAKGDYEIALAEAIWIFQGMETPLRYLGEWERHDAVWLAWPSNQAPWGETPPEAVQAEFTAFCHAIADPDANTGKLRGEPLNILVPHLEAENAARAAMGNLNATYHPIPYGDIWLRDTGPIFIKQGHQRQATAFRFNGWGQKFIYPNDDTVAVNIARASGDPPIEKNWILEGGSIESDGEGTLLTTEECLLNPNRNPTLSRTEIEANLREDIGASKVLWLKQGLIGDHTDGHIDNVARFIAPGRVVCMASSDPLDPNHDRLRSIQKELGRMTDAKGRRLDLSTVPSPGRVYDRERKLMPASYLNFYLSNSRVIVPTYQSSYDSAVVQAFQSLFPEREVIGSPSWNILHGGGSFHCITQHVPTLP
jgi:agmatine deiminase|tara:strand:- start:152220 stop:153335 length:1116 start_codon:yes stop_codon:yes gene_type:complete